MKTKFDMQRDDAMKGLAKAREEGKADEDIASLVDAINSKKDLYTTSSCAGRICVLQTPMVHDKLKSEWLGKWHREVTLQEVKEALAKHEQSKEDIIYLQAECPILHVVARDLDAAKRLLKLAQESGFKRSGIQAVNKERVVLEILSTEQMEVPLAEGGAVLVDDDYIDYIIKVANAKLRTSRKKMTKLEKMVKGL